jgi:hypothetical protein
MMKKFKAALNSLALLGLATIVFVGVVAVWLEGPSLSDNQQPEAKFILPTFATALKDGQRIVRAKANEPFAEAEPIGPFVISPKVECKDTAITARPARSL